MQRDSVTYRNLSAMPDRLIYINWASWPEIFHLIFLGDGAICPHLQLHTWVNHTQALPQHSNATCVMLPVPLLLGTFVSKPASQCIDMIVKVAFGKSLEDACGASAQEALEELGCWSDNDFEVFGGKFLGQLNITPGWTHPSLLSPVLSSSLSLSLLLPLPTFSCQRFMTMDSWKKVFTLHSSHALCECVCMQGCVMSVHLLQCHDNYSCKPWMAI